MVYSCALILSQDRLQRLPGLPQYLGDFRLEGDSLGIKNQVNQTGFT